MVDGTADKNHNLITGRPNAINHGYRKGRPFRPRENVLGTDRYSIRRSQL